MRFRTSVTEVSRNFAEYINRVAYRGERFTLMRGKKPVAELTPVTTGQRLGDLPELLASLPRLGEQEASSLAVDLKLARESLESAKVADPWES